MRKGNGLDIELASRWSESGKLLGIVIQTETSREAQVFCASLINNFDDESISIERDTIKLGNHAIEVSPDYVEYFDFLLKSQDIGAYSYGFNSTGVNISVIGKQCEGVICPMDYRIRHAFLLDDKEGELVGISFAVEGFHKFSQNFCRSFRKHFNEEVGREAIWVGEDIISFNSGRFSRYSIDASFDETKAFRKLLDRDDLFAFFGGLFICEGFKLIPKSMLNHAREYPFLNHLLGDAI